MNYNFTPQAIFDTAEILKKENTPAVVPKNFHADYQAAKQFLLSYQYNPQTFKSFRRDIERFMQWSWFIKQQACTAMRRADIEDYLIFCQKPPLAWISTKNVARFLNKQGKRQANPQWRPFVAHVSNSAHQRGLKAESKQYTLSEKGFREIFTILNCFYNFLIQEDRMAMNPVAQIRQKNRFYRKQQGQTKIRRISELQWQYVIETAETMANEDPKKHERTLFIISLLYSLYLRISELVASERWVPKMNDFVLDHDGLWWFMTIGKGNKERQISVSNDMLKALQRWRSYLKLTPALPVASDHSPLIPKQRGRGPLSDTRHVRHIVQICFDQAAVKMQADGFTHEAEGLAEATVHWLRHTGISDDVKFRPREHVRDDAGHSSSAITDKYIDIDRRERHASAKKKRLKQDD